MDGLDACWLDSVTYTPTFATGPPYAQWLNTRFPSTQRGNGLLTGPTADPDGDGRTNLYEYAFGGSPVAADALNPITLLASGSEVFFDYMTDSSKTDLLITPRLSDTLASWTNGTSELVSQNGNLSQRRVRVPKSAGKKFLMLKAELTP